jgi:diguanylate cyclase (GGDEF)-like protein
MSSKKKSPSKSGNKRERRSARPILWVGGSGIPGGAAGKGLVGLGHPLHWEGVSVKAARSVAALAPVLVVIEIEKPDSATRNLLAALAELKPSVDTVVFQLRRRGLGARDPRFDGVFQKGPSLLHQLRLVLGAMEGSRSFKAAGARANKRLLSAQAEIQRLRTLAVRDDLTSLYNLRFFKGSLETEHQRATRFGRSYALIFMDLDGLREVNSRGGHLAGAKVLVQVGDLLVHRTRRIDLPARIGGDEFVIICPETEKGAVRLVAERLRHGVQKLEDAQGNPLGITVSIGIACFPEDGDLPEEVLHRADRALYEAKALGKNRVCCWGEFAAEADEKSFLGSVYGMMPEEPAREKEKAKKSESLVPSGGG